MRLAYGRCYGCVRMLRLRNHAQVVRHTYFKNFIVGAIVLAGMIVGTNTYLDCGEYEGLPATSCYEYEDASKMWATTVCLSGNNWTEGDCRAANCCYAPAASGNSTAHCWERGPMPECMTGQTAADVSSVLNLIDEIILYIFTLECVLKLASNGKRPWRYFYDMWNTFDFFIVLACYMPAGGNVAVLRLMRLMRLLKLLHTVENLQIILSGLSAGFGSIGYILVLMLLVFYLFAVVSIMMFKTNDHVHFEDMDTAMITLFRMSTMEDWTDVMYINMLGCDKYGYGSYCYNRDCSSGDCDACSTTCLTPEPWGYLAAIFFSAFIVISGYVVMSLFIGVITTSMAVETDKHTQMKRAGKQELAKARFRHELEDRRAKGIVKRPSDELPDEKDEDEEHVVHPNAIIDQYLQLGEHCSRIVETDWFGMCITGCIIVAAALIGAQTYPEMDKYSTTMDALDAVILVIFGLEIMLKLCAAQLKPWTFFYSRWNSFDFAVVTVCLMPFGSDMVAVLRLLRLLRVLKLFKALPQLQIILSGLAQGMSSIGYIALLLILMFYVMGIVAIMFFRVNDPVHFGNLQVTFVTLFRCATFEDWTDVMYIAMYGCKMWSFGQLDVRCENSESYGLLAACFFLSFILFSALIMLNLVIGSICSSMSDAQEAFDVRNERQMQIERVVQKTRLRGRDYGLKGISYQVIDQWVQVFNEMDSASSALALEASVHKDDLHEVRAHCFR
eukprot:COSAG01_NODE_1861_length_9039_cov_6.964094_10_plen_728_part_00